ncbi:MAG: hypothetical protein FWG16_04910 [Micrococcales bacterium]|nr:hypothetical protein [Micrococcales bacterium]
MRWPAVVVIVLVVAGLVTSGSMVALNYQSGGLSKQDYYQVGSETVPSVKKVLGTEREVAWSTEDSRTGTEQIVVAYLPPPEDNHEWSTYVDYLQADQGFTLEWTSAPDSISGSVVVSRATQDDPFRLYVRVDWGESDYIVTVIRSSGQV